MGYAAAAVHLPIPGPCSTHQIPYLTCAVCLAAWFAALSPRATISKVVPLIMFYSLASAPVVLHVNFSLK